MLPARMWWFGASLIVLPWSGRVGAGLAAESAAVTSTAQRMRHRQVNIPLLRLLLGDWAPQLPLHGDPGLAPGRAWVGSPPGCQPLRAAKEESRVRAGRAAPLHPTTQPPGLVGHARHRRGCPSSIQPGQRDVPGAVVAGPHRPSAA